MKIDWELFRFPFSDRDWQNKFVIGAGLSLVALMLWMPFFWLMLPVNGYTYRIMRRIIKGETPSMPKWDSWGELFSDGLRMWVVSFVYGLPLLIILCCVYSIWFGMGFGFPLLMAGSGRNAGAAASGMIGMMIAGYGLSFFLFALMMLLVIPTAYLQASALTRLVANDSVSSAFQFGEVWKLVRRGWRNYTLAFIPLMGVAMIIWLITYVLIYSLVLACVYPFAYAVAIFYINTMGGALMGMAYYHTEHPGESPSAPLSSAPPPTAPLKSKTDTDPQIKTDPLLKQPAAHDLDDPKTLAGSVPASAATLATGQSPRIEPTPTGTKPARKTTPRKKKTPGEGQP